MLGAGAGVLTAPTLTRNGACARNREYKSESLTLVQFATVFSKMGVKDERVIRSMFEAWDTDQSGTVDFSELLHAIAITAGGSLEDKLTLCFRAFDLNGDGAYCTSCVLPRELRWVRH